MPRSKKKAVVVSVAEPVVEPVNGAKASLAIKTALRNKLKTRMKLMSMSRLGGSRQEINQAVQAFNDGDEEKLELLKDVQDDVKGMNPKNAKKYLRKVIGTLDPKQKESFVDMVKDKLPSNQSKQIVDYVNRDKSSTGTTSATEIKTTTLNPETVYVPVRLMSEEQKTQAKLKRSTDPLVVKKKKKFFSAINVQVPKLADLNKDTPVPLPLPKPTEESNKPARNYQQRLEALQKFDRAKVEERMKLHIMESANQVRIGRITSVTPLAFSDLLIVTETKEPVEFNNIPEEFRAKVRLATVGTWVGSDKHSWMYCTQGESYFRAQNAYTDCQVVVKKFAKILKWLESLRDQPVPIDCLGECLAELGILEEKANSGTYRLLCREYKDPKMQNISVPIVPFVQISFRVKE